MKYLTALAALLFLASGAQAMTYSKVAVAGKPIRIGFYTVVKPDCSSPGVAEIKQVEPPSAGKLTITQKTDYPAYVSANVRQRCNKVRVPGMEILYTGQKAGTTDHFVIDAVSPDGHSERVNFSVQIR